MLESCHAQVGSLERSDAPPESGPHAAFRFASSPALPDWRYPRSRSFQDRAACYHFATQLDGTGQNGTVWRPGYGRKLGPKTLTESHAMELGGMARAELANRRLQPLGHVSGDETSVSATSAPVKEAPMQDPSQRVLPSRSRAALVKWASRPAPQINARAD
jgi:hypothetical protein